MSERRAESVDPITLSVVQGVLSATQRAMTLTMEKTGRSSVYAIARDYSNAVFDWQARMILQGEDLPTHLGSLIMATKAVAKYFEGDVHPGDVMFHNDPTYDGSHIPDMCMYKPVFYDGDLAFWAVSKGHVIDAGGPVPGSYNSGAKEIYAEGLRIPPIKIIDRGVPREDVINLILTNVRRRENQRGDMNAQLAAVTIGEHRLRGLLDKFGSATVRACVDQLLDVAEAHMREIIGHMPDGTYQSSILAEDTGHGRGDQRITAEATVDGDDLYLRLDAPEQLDFYTNSYMSNTMSGVYAGLMMFAQVEPPFNEGLYRPVHVDVGPPATMVNAREPAPHVNCTGGPQETICDVVRQALNEADLSSAAAGWNHTWAANVVGKWPETGEPYVEMIYSTLIGGGGAVVGLGDGWHAVGAQASLGAMQTGDSEFVEMMSPIIVHRLSLAPDSAGPGRWRGGCGLITEFEPIGHDMTVIAWGEGTKFPAPGVAGAEATMVADKLARGWHVHGDEILREIDGNATFVLKPGERYVNRSPGGGGAGDPLDRPVEAVQKDVIEEKVTAQGAYDDYGVVVDPTTLRVDHHETEATRQRRKAARP